jgi:hypothetical protein
MKRILTTLWGLVLMSMAIHAQDILNIQASSGIAVPLGRIASTNVKDSSAGYASTGGMVEFRMGIKPFKFVGICFSGGLGMLPVNANSIKKYVDSQHGIDEKPVANNHRFGYASAGFMFAYRPPIKDKWILDASVTGGYLWAEMPDISVIKSGTIFYKSYLSFGGGWMVSANFSFRFRVYRSLYVGSGLEYLYARPRFTNLIVEERVAGNTVTQQNTFAQNMSMIYWSAQIGVTF